MPSQPAMAESFVSHSRRQADVGSEQAVQTTTDAPFAQSPVTEPAAAHDQIDPRIVTTPLDADLIEVLLRNLGIEEDWKHIVHGLRNGFNVGIQDNLNQSFIFDNHKSSNLVRTS